MAETDRRAAPLAIRLFGTFDVRVRGEPLPHLRSRKEQLLLALLILRRDRPIARAELAQTLWPFPDHDESQARENLRHGLYHLRQALGAEGTRLRSPTPQHVSLDLSEAEADVTAFDEAVGQGDVASLERAVALYAGPLLSGCTETWAVQEREQRRQAYLKALETLAEYARAGGDDASAIRFLRLTIAADPLRESARRALMQVLAEIGEHQAALKVFRELRELLRDDPTAGPAPETRALYERIRAETRRHAQVAPDASSAPPPHPSPRSRTPLVGRAKEIRAIKARLTSAPLVTLTGTGGIGKTRLALRVAEGSVQTWRDGVWLLELVSVSDAARLAEIVAAALKVREEPDRPLREALFAALRAREALLVLDNLEQIAAGAAEFVGALLSACPRLTVLATSRTPLGVSGEQVYEVPPLALPARRTAGADLPALLSFDAVQLFVQRAEVFPEFAVNSVNVGAVAELCRRLDGLPLAIELAAAQTRVLSVDQILGHLRERLLRFRAEHPDRDDPRHETLRATIDWSHDLLTEAERALFRRLSVFLSRFDLDAVEAVCGDGSGDMLETLKALIRHALLRADTSGAGPASYWLLETIRRYAEERLREAGEGIELRARHAAYYLFLAEAAEPQLEPGCEDGQMRVWLGRLDAAHENLRAALDWFLEREDAESGLRLAGALCRYWSLRGRHTEARGWLNALLSRSGEAVSPGVRSKALTGAGFLASDQGRFTEARSLLEESLAIRRNSGEKKPAMWTLFHLGTAAHRQREDPDLARRCLEECLALARELGDRWALASALGGLGDIAWAAGDFAAARSLLEQSLALQRELDNRSGMAFTLLGLGGVLAFQNDLAGARSRFVESLRIQRDLGDRRGIAYALVAFACLAAAQGEPEHAKRAARLFGAADALRESIGAPLSPADLGGYYDLFLGATRAALGEEAFAAAWRQGRAMPLEQAIAGALGDGTA